MMASLMTLFISLILGVALQKVKNIPPNAPTTLGTLILFIPLPAICLLTLPDLKWNLSLISLALVTWIIFGIAFILFPFLGKKFHWDKELIGCLILTAGFCNSAFVGFPIIETLFGSESLKHAIFLDQSGSFLIVSSFGIWIAITYSSGKMRKRVLVKKILLFPPFLAFLTGLVMGSINIRVEGISREVLERLASLLTPLALICVGLQLRWSELQDELKYLALGLSYKLVIGPLVIFILYYSLGVDLKIFQVAVMESAMAPMITSSILAATHHLRPKLAGMMVGVGVPLSFFTLTLWYYLLKFVSS